MGVPGNTDCAEETVSWRAVNVPKRARATTSGHRSAAQNGQNSPPTNSTSGLPSRVRAGAPARTVGGVSVVPVTVTPTWSKVATGILDRVARTAGDVTAGAAGVVGDTTWVRA